MHETLCLWCKARVPDIDGPTHRYMESSPGCWAAYGEVLAREYSDAVFLKNHRLTVDAYAAQHPGRSSPQSIQSVGIHLVSLYLVLERHFDQSSVTRLMSQMAEKEDVFKWLNPPTCLGELTVNQVLEAKSSAEHLEAVVNWARSVWQAWATHQPIIREWASLLNSQSKADIWSLN